MLSKQVVQIDCTQGLDTKSDEKLVLPGKWTRLENAGWDGPNTLSKVGGYGQLSAGPGSARDAWTRGDELVVENSEGVLSSYGSRAWTTRGASSRWSASKESVIRNPASQSAFDVGYAQNVEAYAWEDSRGGIRTSVRDRSTGAFYISDGSLSATGTQPRILSGDGSLYLLYCESTNLQLRVLSAASPSTWGSATTVVTNVATSAVRMDAVLGNGVIWLAYRSSANQLEIRRVSVAGSVLHTATVAENPNRGLCVFYLGANDRVGVVYQGSAAGELIYRVYGNTLTSAGGPTVIETAPSTTFERICGLTASSASTATVFWESPGATADVTTVRAATVNDSGTVTLAAAVRWRSVGLGSLPFNVDGDPLLALVHESELQPTVFVIAAEPSQPNHMRARLVAGNGGGLHTTPRLPHAAVVSENEYVLPVLERGRLSFAGGENITAEGISAVTLRNDEALQTLTVNDVAFLCGAVPMMYDSNAGIVEAGFHLYPERVSVVADVGAGDLSAGVYQCCALYEWTDGVGNLHRSAASPPVEVTVAAGDAIDWTLPTLRLTDKRATNSRAEVRIVPYRTEADGVVFYRVTAPEDSPVNDTTADTVAFADDGLADADLIGNEPMPWQGGVLDAGPIPPCRTACIHQERLVLGGLVDGREVAFSTFLREKEGPRFHESQRKRVDMDAVNVKALRSMDEVLFIFTDEKVYGLPGLVPDDTGLNGSLGTARPIPGGMGCSDFRTLVELPDGLARQTDAGFFLLTRGLQDFYFGADVEDYNSTSFRHGVVIPEDKQARWYSTGGTVLVYDWSQRSVDAPGWFQWATLSNHAAVAALRWNGLTLHVTSAGVVHSATGYTHNGTAISAVYETGWIHLAGIHGLKRLWRLLLNGQKLSPGTLLVEVAYDYNPTYSTAFSVSLDTVAGATNDRVLELRHHLATQKCNAIRVRITESGATNPHQGVRLASLGFEVGLKKGGRKLAAARTV